jgi:uncharacterized damage-inducible protein DinB
MMMFIASLTFSAFAQGAMAPKPAAPAAELTGQRAEIWSEINEAGKKLVSLAEAMSQEQYSWRPMEGVRSVSEVYMHIAQANFGIPGIAGAKPAADVPKGMDKITEKAKVIDLLKRSFEHVHQALVNTSDTDLERKVKLFGSDSSVRGLFLLIATHAHEHLGQSIAYARTNKVVPPWTAAAQQSQRP